MAIESLRHKALLLLRSELELVKVLLTQQSLSNQHQHQLPPIQWSARPYDLVELVYALHHSGCLGDTTLKEAFLLFESIFKIKINNYSHIFGRIRIRQGERCTFITRLWHILDDVICNMDR